MIQRAFSFYIKSFKGLSRDVWTLALVMLINRSGAMVIPFLTVYMTQELDFSKTQAGLVMSCFGVGSLIGTFAGGQLTDRLGYYPVQFWSLILTGSSFLVLMHLKTMAAFCAGVFVISIVAEAFRPANFASVAAYAKPENITRSYSLIRLAVNLGFSVGPALGGWLAHRLGYDWLFVVDGITCILAALVFRMLLVPKKEAQAPTSASSEGQTVPPARQSAYHDRGFLLFMVFVTLTAITFMQFFSVLPVYFREHFQFNEGQIGLLLAMNGLIIALTEMPMVFRLEGRFSKYTLAATGALLIGTSFLIFNLWPGFWWIAVWSIFLITVGEMLNFPFSNALALQRSNPSNRGQYMGLYSMGFSLAHILSPSMGMQVAENFGYTVLWYLVFGLALFASAGLWMLNKSTAT